MNPSARGAEQAPTLLSFLLLFFVGACAAGASKPSDPAPRAADREAPQPGSEPWAGGSEIMSNDGTWKVVYKTPNGPIQRGETFAIEAWVFAAVEPGKPRQDVSLAVDAAMPQHGHGMNLVPRIEKLEGGRFRVEGLLFHMSGKWQIYFDVGSGPLVERAQTDVEVE